MKKKVHHEGTKARSEDLNALRAKHILQSLCVFVSLW